MGFLFPYKTKVQRLESLDLNLFCLESLDATIDALFAQYEKDGKESFFAEHCPYFGVPWPSGEMLAAYALKQELRWRGKEILEVGCGLALPSLVLHRAGHQITAADWHPDVPLFLEKNWELNGLPALPFLLSDWIQDSSALTYDVVLASDVLYDRALALGLVPFLERKLRAGGECILVDPGRPFFDAFLEQAKQRFQLEQWLERGQFCVRLSRGRG